MSKPFVIVSHTLPAAWVAKLEQECEVLMGPETAVCSTLTPELEAKLPKAVGLMTMLTVPVNGDLLNKAPNLRVVSNMAVGTDNIDKAACTARGIPVGNTPGVLTESTADLAIAILLAAARRLPTASRDAKEGRWQTWSPTAWLGTDLYGATLGIVGLGKIGTAIAQRARAFGLNIVYHNRNRKPEAERTLPATYLPLDELLAQSDFVMLSTPLTAETHHLIDATALQKMKSSAILVNIARGPVVDTNALVQALQENWIQSAALDVTDPEPLPSSHILYSLPNCFITPHIGSAASNTRRRMAELACENLIAGVQGKPLIHCVNPDVYAAA
ncbi:MAG: D-glycerate dehydrogenase [Chloroflexota bacterium]